MAERTEQTVTLLYTDIEGSTRRWEAHPAAMAPAVARHDALLRQTVETHGGHVFKTIGDAVCAAFPTAPAALTAAIAAQRALTSEPWDPVLGGLPVRMALHTGPASWQQDEYFGLTITRISSLVGAGHGGQVLLSRATAELVRDTLPPDTSLQDLGEHLLRDLSRPERLYQLVVPDLPAEFPPLRTLAPQRTNLPIQPTALIGRTTERAAVAALLRQPHTRLLTLTGPGGTGKTRLAAQVGADLLAQFTHGVYWVELAALQDPALVSSTIAVTFGLQEASGRAMSDVLKDYLRDKQMLLILDNFEQVIDAASLVGELLVVSAKLKVLVTSRVSLRLRGEQSYPVPPLALPDPGHLPPLEQLSTYDAVALFIARAQDGKPDFALSNTNASAVAAICARLDGLPLAIELAAARVKLLAPDALLKRLESRLKLLVGGAKDLPARQQTLRGAIAWSYELLAPAEQALFRRLGVFAGGATLEAVEAVAGASSWQEDVLEGLGKLVEGSLLRQQQQPDSSARFVLLETIREFALEQLAMVGEADVAQGAHGVYYTHLAEEAALALYGPLQVAWLDRLETEHDNLRTALRTAVDQENIELRLRLVGALGGFWQRRGYWQESHSAMLAALAQQQPAAETLMNPGLWARVFFWGGVFELGKGGYSMAVSLLEQALALYQEADNAQGMGRCLLYLSSVTSSRQNYAAAKTHLQQAHDLFQRIDDKGGLAGVLNNLGAVVSKEGDYVRARTLREQSLQLFREVGDVSSQSNVLYNLGIVAEGEGDFVAAQAFYEQGLALARRVRNPKMLSVSLIALGELLRAVEDYAGARPLLEEGLTLAQDIGDLPGVADAQHNLGYIAFHEGNLVQARALFADGLTRFHSLELMTPHNLLGCLVGLSAVAGAEGQWTLAARWLSYVHSHQEAVRLSPANRLIYERTLAPAQTALAAADFAAAWAAGQTLTVEEAIAEALEVGADG